MVRMLALLLFAAPALALTPAAKEFIDISKKLEPVQCEKRGLRRGRGVAVIEKCDVDVARIRHRFAEINAKPETAKLEKRLGELEKRLIDPNGRARHPEDLEAISLQQREAFYRCE